MPAMTNLSNLLSAVPEPLPPAAGGMARGGAGGWAAYCPAAVTGGGLLLLAVAFALAALVEPLLALGAMLLVGPLGAAEPFNLAGGLLDSGQLAFLFLARSGSCAGWRTGACCCRARFSSGPCSPTARCCW